MEYSQDNLSKALSKARRLEGEVDRTIRHIPGGEDLKAFTLEGAKWLMNKGLIGIEAWDDEKIYYRLVDTASDSLFEICSTYWPDQRERLEVVMKKLRPLRLQIIMEDLSPNIVEPGEDADASEWEHYAALLELETTKADARKTVNEVNRIIPSAPAITSTPEAPLKKHGKNDAIVYAVCFVVLVLVVFMIIAIID